MRKPKIPNEEETKKELETLQEKARLLRKQLPRKAKRKKLPVAISEEEFIALIKHTQKERHKLAFLLGYGAGLRVSEVLALQPSDFNMVQRSILVRQGKGSKDRTVPIPKGFKQAHLKLLPFTMKTPRALQYVFKDVAERAGLFVNKPTLHFHSLRHGFATNAVSKGLPIHHIRTLMGHSNISTTNVYLEANPKEALRNYEELF